MRNKDRDPSSLSDSPMAGLHKTFTQLQQKAQPKIDAARYKAEAGLSRRGFVHHQQGKWLREDVEASLIDDDGEFGGGGMGDRSLESLEDEGMGNEETDRGWDERLKKVRANFEGRERERLKDKEREKEKEEVVWGEERNPLGEGWRPLA